MARPLKLQTSLKILREQRERTSIPCSVPLTGRDSPVVCLEGVADEDLRRDFSGASYLMEFSEQYEDNENDDAYRACLQELEELLLEQHRLVDEVETNVVTVASETETSQSQQQLQENQDIGGTLQMQPHPESASASSSSQAVTSGSVPVVEEPASHLQQPAPVQKQGTVLTVEPQDDFPMDNNDMLHDDNTNAIANEDDDRILALIPTILPTAPWETYWREMEAVGGWTLRTGGRPYLYVKPGRNTRRGESKLGIDYLDTEEDVQAFARLHYGWCGNSDDANDVGQDTQGIVSAAVVTPSPSKVPVLVKCPICSDTLTTYRGQDRIPLPLTADGIADWDQDWPTRKSIGNKVTLARGHFTANHKLVDLPWCIRRKNAKRGSPKHPNGMPDFGLYKSLYRHERNERK